MELGAALEAELDVEASPGSLAPGLLEVGFGDVDAKDLVATACHLQCVAAGAASDVEDVQRWPEAEHGLDGVDVVGGAPRVGEAVELGEEALGLGLLPVD